MNRFHFYGNINKNFISNEFFYLNDKVFKLINEIYLQ